MHNHDGVRRQARNTDKYLWNETTASKTLCAQPSPSQPHRLSYPDHPPYVRAPLRPTVATMAMPRSTTTSPPHHRERTVLTRRRRAGRRRDRLLRHRSPHTPSPRPQCAPCDPQPPEHRRAAPPTRPRPASGCGAPSCCPVPHAAAPTVRRRLSAEFGSIIDLSQPLTEGLSPYSEFTRDLLIISSRISLEDFDHLTTVY